MVFSDVAIGFIILPGSGGSGVTVAADATKYTLFLPLHAWLLVAFVALFHVPYCLFTQEGVIASY